MKMTIVSVVAILVIIALVVTFSLRNRLRPVPSVTPDEAAILESQINTLTEEQLAAISTDLTDYSTTVEDEIASNTGMFMYQ